MKYTIHGSKIPLDSKKIDLLWGNVETNVMFRFAYGRICPRIDVMHHGLDLGGTFWLYIVGWQCP